MPVDPSLIFVMNPMQIIAMSEAWGIMDQLERHAHRCMAGMRRSGYIFAVQQAYDVHEFNDLR